MDDFDLSVQTEALQRVEALQARAAREAQETHQRAVVLAERVAAYYRELVRQMLPQDLTFQLVEAYHAQELERMGYRRDPRGQVVDPVVYVPVPLSEE